MSDYDMARSAGGKMRTHQEKTWAGEFGTRYTNRNVRQPAADLAFWSRILARTRGVRSVLELGAGSGHNLVAIKTLLPDVPVFGVEINEHAFMEMLRVLKGGAVCSSILDWEPRDKRDLVITKGLLIHIAPSDLPEVYRKVYEASGRYIVIAEYYSPTPVSVEYRGNEGLLWKRDFAGEMLDRYSDLRLVDYGWVWRRDVFAQDDVSWFLMERA